MTDREETNDLALTSSIALVSVFAVLLGIAGAPVAGGAAAGGAVGMTIVQRIKDRRESRKRKRLEKILECLVDRVSDIGSGSLSDEHVDLFVEVLEKAISDDEEQKEIIYAGVLEWIIRIKPHVSRVRILSDAVRNLSYLELYCFLIECQGKQAKKIHEPLISENILWKRLGSHGLSDGSSRVNGSPTIFGRLLMEYCPLEDLSEPKVE